MVKEIVGIRPYSFVDERTKGTVEGYTLYLQWEEEDVAGYCCEKASVAMNKLDGYAPELGGRVHIGYNKYGKVDFVIAAAGE